MRSILAAAGALLAGLLLLASPASAITCSYPPSAYSSAGPAGSGAVNDPLFARQWGLTQIHAPDAWAHGYRGAGATIAIVDTGVDLNHPDLRPHIVGGADLDPGNPGDATTPPTPAGGQCPGPQDENGHGTHVAGIAAAMTGNGIGVAGTAPDASIMPVRVLDANGSGQDATVVAGIRWAADHGAKVINLSLGGMAVYGELPQTNQQMADAVAYAFGKGALVVAAAGNENVPLCSYPAAASGAVCVGATDSSGRPSFYSNFPNSPSGDVGVRAPGGFGDPLGCESDLDVWSTIWPGSSMDCQGVGHLTGYETLAGTSMASPFVSGVAALLSAKGLSAGQILSCLMTTSSNRGSYDPVNGYGIVDAAAATSTCTPQSTPTVSPAGLATRAGQGGSAGARPGVGVRMRRISARRLAKRRRLRVLVSSPSPGTVTLQLVLRRPHRRGRLIATKRVTFRRAGAKWVTLRLSRSGAHALRRRGASFQLLFRSGGVAGAATVY